MADELVNPYANPYLPSFVNQRPRVNQFQQPMNPVPNPVMPQFQAPSYSQIHSVKGFDGARAYSLANGASEILAEIDPNLARVYVVAMQADGQRIVQGFDLVPVEEPKPVTMDDLNSKMNALLERIDKLEEEKVKTNDQPVRSNSWNNASNAKSGHAGSSAAGRNGSNVPAPANDAGADGSK